MWLLLLWTEESECDEVASLHTHAHTRRHPLMPMVQTLVHWCCLWAIFRAWVWFSIETLHAPCHYRGRGVLGFQKSDMVDEPLQLRDTPLIRDWLRQSIAWRWPALLKIRHSSTVSSFFLLFKPLCMQTASPQDNWNNGLWLGLKVCSV